MYDCFCPGDVIYAKVLKIAGTSSKEWLLSTAENESGVIFAENTLSGELMVPKDWSTMQCPDTRNREKRKVAKPV
jgi:exosome complex RNA-binding protein Csl4